MRKLLSALIALGLLVPIAASPVSATYGECSGPDNNYHAYLDRIIGPFTTSYMQATIWNIKPIRACTSSTNENNRGSAFVLPVNIQGNAFVQLGMCYFGTNGPLTFCYTHSESSGGVMSAAPAESPEIGNDYKFYAAYRSDVDKWRYTIQDTSDNESWSWYGATATRTYGTRVWSGFEVYNDQDQLGGPINSIRIQDIGYKFNNELIYMGSAQDNWVSCCGTKRSWWNTSSGLRSDGRAYIQAWSTNP